MRTNLRKLNKNPKLKFEFLYNEYSLFVTRVVKQYSRYQRIEDVEDHCQELWCKIYEHIDKIDLEHKFLKNYLRRSAMFMAINNYNKKHNKIYKNETSDNIFLDTLVDEYDKFDFSITDHLLFSNDMYCEIDHYFKQNDIKFDDANNELILFLRTFLSDYCIKLLIMRYYHGYTYKAISEQLGVSNEKLRIDFFNMKHKIDDNIDSLKKLIYN